MDSSLSYQVSYVYARSLSAETTAAGLRYRDPEPARALPSARRGHTWTIVDDYSYLFGGWTNGYTCSRGQEHVCSTGAGLSNELWRFDAKIDAWTELVVTDDKKPPPREKHSASLVQERLLVFSGKTDYPLLDEAPAGDLWELSISSRTRLRIITMQGHETFIPVLDGKQSFAMESMSVEDDMCIVDMTVKVDLSHTCSQTLEIELFGPGSSTFAHRQLGDTFPIDPQTEETVWNDKDGFQSGNTRQLPLHPRVRSYPVILQRSDPYSPHDRNGATCTSVPQHLVYTSKENSSPSDKSFESLSVFHQLPPVGDWTLGISDTAMDGHEGVLNSWEMKFTLSPCVPTYEWKDLTSKMTGQVPSPRYHHTAIMSRKSLFVYGGYRTRDNTLLSDLYRLDYESDKDQVHWVQLQAAVSSLSLEKMYHTGRQLMLTPFELVTLDKGIRSTHTTDSTKQNDSYLLHRRVTDANEGWQVVKTHVQHQEHFARQRSSRYNTASVFVYVQKYIGDRTDMKAYTFGGEDDTTIYNDMWSINVDQLSDTLSYDHETDRQKVVCSWRMTNSAYEDAWSASCGSMTLSDNTCALETLLLYAWCDQSYQSICL